MSAAIRPIRSQVRSLAIGREGSAFFERRDFSTRFGWRTSGNHPLNASARIVVRLLIPPVLNPSADSKPEPFAFGKARIFARRMFSPSRSRSVSVFSSRRASR